MGCGSMGDRGHKNEFSNTSTLGNSGNSGNPSQLEEESEEGSTPQQPSSPLSDCETMNTMACDTFNLINIERINVGLPSLKISINAIKAAQFHSDDMYENNFFSHNSPDESWIERLSRFGVSGGIHAENIAVNNRPVGAVSSWMNSLGHRQNILSPSYKYSGVGYRNGYWVQVFSSIP